MTPSPILLQYEGDGAFKSSPRAKAVCDERFVVGAYYPMMEWQDRSQATHGHMFAWLHEAWQNLPENLKDEYPTPEALRKRALIQAGFFHEEVIDAGSKAAALRVAAFARRHDDFAHVVTRGPLVVIRTAKSQSRRAMDKKEFQASKEKVLEVVAAMIGVAPDELAKQETAA